MIQNINVPITPPNRVSSRYLVSFNTSRSIHYFTDVLIIGAGIAGIRAALEFPASCQVLVITKGEFRESNSSYAQGGIAGVLSKEDSFQNHIDDTHRAGAGLCEEEVVEFVIREAPNQIKDLIDFGTKFDQQEGHLALTREGGHSHRRIVHALGDATGHEVMRALLAKARSRKNITLWDQTFILDLLKEENTCVGGLIYRQGFGKMNLWARQTILASGGCGQIYRETTNPLVATGDGMAAAYRAGAAMRDMEFMQFHPTVLYVAGSARYLISEAVRGEGAYLRDVNGERFMTSEDERGELAPRDVVSQAIFRCMERTKHPNVYLDLSHLDPALIRERFPGINRVCRSFGLDITRDRIPVRPGAHYMIGGVVVDMQARTSIPHLLAAGEVTSSGLHGGNRLASNSLIEGLVYGTQAARTALSNLETSKPRNYLVPLSFEIPSEDNTLLDINDLTLSLRNLMMRKMGIVRDQQLLREAQEKVGFWCRYVLNREFDVLSGWELQNMLTIAQLMIDSAIVREESRGTHFRSDYPNRDDLRWKTHLITSLQS